MPQLRQPIREAIQRGERGKAIELIKQALAADPNDIEVLLLLAAILDEPDRKRQVLQRVLSIAPENTAARKMLFEVDLAERSLALDPVPEKPPVMPQVEASGHSRRYATLQPTTRLDSAFSGTTTFRRGFFKQYGGLFLLIPLFVFFTWLGLALSAETRIACFVTAGLCALLMLLPFFQISGLKVEPDKLTLQTFFLQKEFSAAQIKEIKMQSMRSRYGYLTNVVSIIPVGGKSYPLSGLAESDEILYGFLLNWWKRYQDR